MLSSESKTNWRFLALAVAVVAVIAHGSLYPYAFYPRGGVAAAVRVLLDSWKTPPSGFPDLMANVLLYVPLGFSGVLAVASRYRITAITIFGFLLCSSIEVAQFFDIGRMTNMSDVYLNTAGTFIGALTGTAAESRLRNRTPLQTTDIVPAVLLLALVAYRLYPYVPTIDVHKYWHSVKPLLLHPGISAWQVFRYFALWLTACYLLYAGLRRQSALAILFFAAFIVGAKIVIVDQTLGASELLGATLAVCGWFAFLQRSRFCAIWLFVLLGTMVVFFRLQPLDFRVATVAPFGWIPFHSIIQGDFGQNLLACGEKIFLYGSLIWIGSRTGLSLWVSTMATALLLLITSIAESHLAGRSAEITDCVMALLLGAGIGALDHAAGSRARGMDDQTGRRDSLQMSS